MSKAKYSGKSQAAKKAPNKNGNSYAKKNGAGTKTAVAKTRKPYLTAALALILVVNIVFTILLFNEKRVLGMAFADVPWYAWVMILTNVINVVAAGALWYWKKWGLYLYIASAAASTLIMLLAGMIGVGFSALAPAAIIAYLISLNWKQFE